MVLSGFNPNNADLPVWIVLTILVPPALALLYAAVCAIFLPFFHECSWITHMNATVLRISVLVVFVAVTAVPSVEQGDFALLFIAGMSTVLSIYLIRRTRFFVVEGGSEPMLLDMQGKVVLITGANTGIGKETALQLAQKGARVILACRSLHKAEAAKKEIMDHLKKKCNRYHGGDDNDDDNEAIVDVLSLDLSSLASVKNAATELVNNNKKKQKVDVLILNAGVMMGKQIMTEDGFELMMQANHLGHYYLTRLLIDNGGINTTKTSTTTTDETNHAARVLAITSSTYSFAESIDLHDLFCTKGRKYTLFGQYAMSKLANILFVKELNRRYPNLFVAAIHPGLVRTNVVRNMPWYLYYPNMVFAFALRTLQKSPAQGAWCTTYIAASSSSRNSLLSGEYWVNRNVQQLWPCAKDEAGASLLWRDSARYVGLDP